MQGSSVGLAAIKAVANDFSGYDQKQIMSERIERGYRNLTPPLQTGERYVEIKKAFRAACKDAQITDFRFHDLRQTAATRLAEAGADAYTIAAILGHSSIQMSALYTHASDERKHNFLEVIPEKSGEDCRKIATKERRKAG
jgi:integrase